MIISPNPNKLTVKNKIIEIIKGRIFFLLFIFSCNKLIKEYCVAKSVVIMLARMSTVNPIPTGFDIMFARKTRGKSANKIILSLIKIETIIVPIITDKISAE